MELIVDFRAAVSEERARAVVTEAGGTVRRRMGNDDPGRVRLLVRAGGEDARALIASSRDVERVEVNLGGFRPV
jgi:metal-dependent HD superfamily phosphatase/phosphodiesterase